MQKSLLCSEKVAMEAIQSAHPVVEELLTNKYFGDTLLVCANGHLTDNKLAVRIGLLSN